MIRLLFLKKFHPSSSLQFPFDFLVWQIAVLQIKTGLEPIHFPPSLLNWKTHLSLPLLEGTSETIWFNVFISEIGDRGLEREHCLPKAPWWNNSIAEMEGKCGRSLQPLTQLLASTILAAFHGAGQALASATLGG